MRKILTETSTEPDELASGRKKVAQSKGEPGPGKKNHRIAVIREMRCDI